MDRDAGGGPRASRRSRHWPRRALPLLWIAHQQPDATIAVFPADHFVWEEPRFLRHMAQAVIISRRQPDRIVLLGMEADSAETGYGRIERGAACGGALPDGELFTVANFWEKPGGGLARQFHTQGCLWNSFVMVGTVHGFLQLIRRHHRRWCPPASAASLRHRGMPADSQDHQTKELIESRSPS